MTESLTERIQKILDGMPPTPDTLIVSPEAWDRLTGRQPREPAMQRIAIVGGDHLAAVAALRAAGIAAAFGSDYATIAGSDFADIEARAMSVFAAEHPDVRDFLDSAIPQERRYSVVPEKGNRAERRRKAAQHRRKK
jgi:hypothetical protein